MPIIELAPDVVPPINAETIALPAGVIVTLSFENAIASTPRWLASSFAESPAL